MLFQVNSSANPLHAPVVNYLVASAPRNLISFLNIYSKICYALTFGYTSRAPYISLWLRKSVIIHCN